MSLIEQIMQTALTAPEDRKAAALKVLNGEAGIADPDNEDRNRPTTGPALMGMGEAARFMGISRPTLWRVIHAGRLGKVELFPGSYRVRRADIEALIARLVPRGTKKRTSTRKTGTGGAGPAVT